MGGFSITHWLLLAFIFLLFFGPNKASDVAKSLGRSIRNFKNSLNEIDVDAKDIQDDPQLLEKQKPKQNQK